MKGIAISTVLLGIRFCRPNCLGTFMKFGENVYLKEIFALLGFRHDLVKTVTVATIFACISGVFLGIFFLHTID